MRIAAENPCDLVSAAKNSEAFQPEFVKVARLQKDFFRATNFLTKNAPKFSPKFLSLCSVGQKNPRKIPSKFPTKFSKFPCEKSKKIHQRASAGAQGEEFGAYGVWRGFWNRRGPLSAMSMFLIKPWEQGSLGPSGPESGKSLPTHGLQNESPKSLGDSLRRVSRKCVDSFWTRLPQMGGLRDGGWSKSEGIRGKKASFLRFLDFPGAVRALRKRPISADFRDGRPDAP